MPVVEGINTDVERKCWFAVGWAQQLKDFLSTALRCPT